ncbi:type IV pilus twitching motility protein PilT [Clostridium aminobutyricum]|uniref:PilT/PilU family type 4a pilus ATPase n=1 Tax=Clostridium aminobutyricum TaxID=33953 RepID=A0A939IIT2_CLOAM|nr:PilT/PilU family type 4a pilus ATPase [Clostridium aminobutyricum]MBN7773396.1 PilT/PilU family type 4a pilus ATPase [Clostridium aminobutyricum]
MNALKILQSAVEQKASDIFLIPGAGFSLKINGRISQQPGEMLLPEDLADIIAQIYTLSRNRSMDRVYTLGDDDFSFSVRSLSRFRASVFKQRGSLAAIIRVVNFELPDFRELNIPETVIDLASLKKGLVLVTGSAGSGKSTTLACIIDQINKNRNAHVITLEDPIEYLHKHDQSIVTQREINTDTEDYVSALRSALRQAPDVILLGELRDYETIRTAMTAAETGHLIISTLHTIGAANTIDRIIDAFPQNQQNQIRTQLSMVLQAVISQQLLPTVDEKTMPAFEIMLLNSAIRNMIRESKIHQIDSNILAGQEEGMISMDISLCNLYKQGKITKEVALNYSSNREMLEKRMERG